jgi:ATP-dependent 26S proteasome regulatory subunit
MIMKEELNILVQAQYPLIYLVTPEEERAEQTIAAIAQMKPQRRVFVWTVTHGIVEHGQPRNITQHNTVSPEAAIEWVVRQREPGVFVFKDLHPFIDSPAVTRWLRDAIASFKDSYKTIILMSPIQQVPIELEKEVAVVDYPLPNLEELNHVLSSQLEQTRRDQLPRRSDPAKISTETREKLLSAALGLTRDEAEKVYRKAYVTAGRLTESEVDIVLSEKRQLIRRNGILEYLEEEGTLDDVGGSDDLKIWLKQRSIAFTERAREYGLPQPKGVLLLGVPGCGKSLVAKATSNEWRLPLLRLDLGRVYDGSMVGRSEANLRNALKTAESVSPAILFIDELDKAFAGGAGSADSDAGTSSRILGTFLTWMQEKRSPVFVMATANRVERLPGEFLRKGRFDEIFFVDLPNEEERKQIFTIHLGKRRRDIARFDVDQLAKMSDGYSGAEIEQAIIAAMYDAFAQNREFMQLDIIAAIKATFPLSRTMTEQVEALRKWAQQRARPASDAIAEYQRLEF